MQYHEWQTFFDEAGRLLPHEKALSLHARSKVEHDRISRVRYRRPYNRMLKLSRLGTETHWVEDGKPYYKVHPKIVGQLARTNLDKIPARMIEIPCGYRAISVRFSEDIPIVRATDESLKYVAFDPGSQLGVRAALFGRVTDPDEPGNQILCLNFDTGYRRHIEGQDCMLCHTIPFDIEGDETIPQALARNAARYAGGDWEILRQSFLLQQPTIEALFRIVVTVGFLADQTDDNLIVPDVLKDDEDRYKRAVQAGDAEAVKRLHERASKRRNAVGWNVGTNEMFVERHRSRGSSGDYEPTGDELEYSHFRSGHPHAVRYGKGKSKVKIKWFRTIRVRPDLPFSPE